MTTPNMTTHDSLRFYERELLPALYGRLDKAFPEFNYSRNACGWVARRRTDNGYAGWNGVNPIVCSHGWGFVDAAGTATSWLAYVAGEPRPAGHKFVDAFCKLARLAGCDQKQIEDHARSENIAALEAHERRRGIVEAFLGYCQAALCSEQAAPVREALHSQHGIASRNLGQLPLGYFPSAGEVAGHLTAAGFTHEEINQSWLVCDERLAGRLIMPWRDRWGEATTIMARDVVGKHAEPAPVLYLRGGEKTEAFGLDVALRSCAGGQEHLVLVEHALQVALLRSAGVCNVAAVGAPGQPISENQWEKLADQGVRSVTLAITNTPAEPGRLLKSLKRAGKAKNSPQVFVLSPRDVSEAAAVARRHEAAEYRDVLRRRLHGYRYIAQAIVAKHRPAATWNDAALADTLNEAVKFDAKTTGPRRALELQRFFWPTILEETGAGWDEVRRLLAGRTGATLGRQPYAWHVKELKQLLRDLKQSLRAEDYVLFRELFYRAACDLGIRPPTAARPWHSSEPEHWVVEESIARPSAPIDRSLFATLESPAGGYEHFPAQTYEPPETAMSNGDSRPSATDVRALAYRLWEERGRPLGLDQRFWYEAETTLKSGQLPAYAGAADGLPYWMY